MVELKDILSKSSVVIAAVDALQTGIANKVNKELEDEISKMRVENATLREKLAFTEKELQDTIRELGELSKQYQLLKVTSGCDEKKNL